LLPQERTNKMKELAEQSGLEEDTLYQFQIVKRVACALVERRTKEQETTEYLLGCAIDACNIIHLPSQYSREMYEKIRNWTVPRLHRQLESEYQTACGGNGKMIDINEHMKEVNSEVNSMVDINEQWSYE